MDVTVTITPLGTGPCPGNGNGGDDPDTYFWEGLSGDFTDASNWEPEGVPGQNDLAIFDKDQSYAVSFGDEFSSRAFVERGFVEFSGGSYTLGGGSLESPSLIVGNDAADDAEVLLTSGHQLDTTFATLGRQGNNKGTIQVSAVGQPSDWRSQGRLTIGDEGDGLVQVVLGGTMTADEVVIGREPGSEGRFQASAVGPIDNPPVTLGNVALGVRGAGSLRINRAVPDGNHLAALHSGMTVLGVEAQGAGGVNLTDGYWRTEGMVVGQAGYGVVLMDGVSFISVTGNEPTVLGHDAGSSGDLGLNGDETSITNLKEVIVGKAGQGQISLDKGTLFATDLRLGTETTGRGVVQILGSEGILGVHGQPGTIVIGAGSMDANRVTLGPGSQGFAESILVGGLPANETNLLLVEGAGLTIQDALVVGGQEPLESGFPTGALVLRMVGIVATGELIVNRGGEVLGSGTIELTGGFPALVTGTVAPGVLVFMTGDFKQDGPAFGRGRGFDTLTIIGDVLCDGSVIVMDIGGDTPGLQDRLIIDGDADLDDVTIKLNFKYGFAPAEGMTIPLIEVTGDGSVVPAALEFTGLEEGFDFDIEIPGDGSVIQMRALSDGIPTSNRAEDLNDDGIVNAVDVQLVINGALGLLDPLETDVNFDKVTNAVDVQMVINAALGL